jgi:hypothetical protein
LRLERFEDLAWQPGRIPAGLSIDVKPSISTGGNPADGFRTSPPDDASAVK